MERVVAYVDGYNLYYGLKSRNWRRFYWLNIQEMARQLLKPDQQLMTTKYFTTIVKRPSDKQRRQAIYLDALRTLNGMEFYYGHFLAETIKCRHCGHSYETHHEKMTDVNISVELMADAFQDAFDVALLVSADSDLVGPARAIRRLFSNKRVVVAFPPERFSSALKQVADGQLFVSRDVLAKSIFPEEVKKPDGFLLRRPAEWR
jgi:uncharacterized LabA/DUF88 family protein